MTQKYLRTNQKLTGLEVLRGAGSQADSRSEDKSKRTYVGTVPGANSIGKKEERLHLRVTGDHHALIEQAAALEGLSLTGFATRHLVDAAVHIVEQHQITILRQEQARAFIQLLEENEPPQGVERLKSHFGKIELPVRKAL